MASKPIELDKYAVIGNPISHSKSPQIHKAFAAQPHINIEIEYDPILVPLDGFKAKVEELIAKGYKGANVTVPFKFEAYELCDTRSSHVQSSGSGAVNTLTFAKGNIHGDNTDGKGLRKDIEQNLSFDIVGKNILILGAGGAARGILNSFVGSLSITIANRTREKALQLIGGINDINVKTFDELDKPFDIVINATSVGLNDTVLPISSSIFGKGCLAYDLMYGRETPFMAQARVAGAQVSDGLGMLVEQAYEAFVIWRNVYPDTKPVIEMLRKPSLKVKA